MNPGVAISFTSSLPEREAVRRDCIRRIAAGDASALDLLYDETHVILYSVAQSILGNAADSEEIVLDVFVYVWRSANTYVPGRGTVITWLIMLGRSRALDRLRSRAATNGREVQCTESLTASALSRDGNNSDHRIMVQRILEQLSCDEREIIELAFYSGFTHRELALKLNVPLGTVKTRVRTVLSRLRDGLYPVPPKL